jgi:hypothetical protein
MYDESKHVQVSGHAVAVSGGAGTFATVQWIPEFSNVAFQAVPEGKKLVLTDVLYNPQRDVTAPHTINIAESNPDGTRRIIIQFAVPPEATQQVHFHTGHVIEPEKKVIVYTDANPPAGQHFSVSLNGYLARIQRVSR